MKLIIEVDFPEEVIDRELAKDHSMSREEFMSQFKGLGEGFQEDAPEGVIVTLRTEPSKSLAGQLKGNRNMIFSATKTPVFNRGAAPDDFLTALVQFGQTAPDEIFEPNPNHDIYSLIAPVLAEIDPVSNRRVWLGGIPQRRAAMLEAMRVHGMLESSGNWNEGVDKTNQSSEENIRGQETGVFQVSYDSLDLDPSGSLNACVQRYEIVTGPQTFIDAMKSNHALAIEYYARLVRVSIRWAGPLISVHGNPPAILRWLSISAMNEFQALINATP
jgi:hypothetical protein